MTTLPVRVLGSAEELPRRIVTTAEVAALCDVPADTAEQRSGVRTRHWLGEDEDPLMQGVAAARGAIADAGLSPDDIDLVLNASGTPMQAIPDGGALIAAELGLTRSFAFSVHATCISFLVALQQAGFLLAAGTAEHILIVSTEGGSRGINLHQPDSALLIGDAAVAFIVGRSDDGKGIVASQFRTDPSGIRYAEIRGFGSRIHPTRVTDRPTDFQFDMNGPALLRGALGQMPPFFESLRPGLSRGLPGIDRVVPHQTSAAGMKLLERFWDPAHITLTLPVVGNTVAASIPLALHRTPVEPGETILLFGTGSGTHYGGLIVEW